MEGGRETKRERREQRRVSRRGRCMEWGRSKLKIGSLIIDEYWRMFQSFCNFGGNPLGSLSKGETKLIRHSSRESP